MLKLITWKEFIGGTLTLAAVYYLIIFVIYYRKGLRILKNIRSPAGHPSGNERTTVVMEGEAKED